MDLNQKLLEQEKLLRSKEKKGNKKSSKKSGREHHLNYFEQNTNAFGGIETNGTNGRRNFKSLDRSYFNNSSG
jgi:hypothetical protein